MNLGTPAELKPIAEEVLAFVARHRAATDGPRMGPEALRRVELCALVTNEVSMFHDLYRPDPTPTGGGPDGTP